MTTKFRLMAFAIIVATLSVQCTKNDSYAPNYPTSVENYFNAGVYAHEDMDVNYQEASINSQSAGKASLVVVLHGQNAAGSDNRSQIRHDTMIRIWHNLSSGNNKVVILAPQCRSNRAWDEEPSKEIPTTMANILKALIDDFVLKRASIDLSRIYIVGYSDSAQPAGAGGVWHMLSNYPDLFAAGMAVAADPCETVVAENVAKTPTLSIKSEMDSHAVAPTLDSFGDAVRDAGGILKEVILSARSREDICRDAFSSENLNWILQYTKKR